MICLQARNPGILVTPEKGSARGLRIGTAVPRTSSASLRAPRWPPIITAAPGIEYATEEAICPPTRSHLTNPRSVAGGSLLCCSAWVSVTCAPRCLILLVLIISELAFPPRFPTDRCQHISNYDFRYIILYLHTLSNSITSKKIVK